MDERCHSEAPLVDQSSLSLIELLAGLKQGKAWRRAAALRARMKEEA